MYRVQGQHELVETEMYLVHGVGRTQNADLQEYAPRICTKDMQQDCFLSMFCFPQDSKLFPPSTVMPLHEGGKHCRVRSPRGEEQAAA